MPSPGPKVKIVSNGLSTDTAVYVDGVLLETPAAVAA